MWPPGVSGNRNGRPVGSRTAFSHGFLKDLAEVWGDRGRAAMERTAIDQPAVFFACSSNRGREMDRDGLIDLTHRSSDGTLMTEVLQLF